MTDTPRTDSQPIYYSRQDARIKCVRLEWAQELERDLNEAREQAVLFYAGFAKAVDKSTQWRAMAQDLAEILKATHSLRDCTPDCEIKIRLERFNKLNE